jgi:hypothetical protein
VEAKEVQRVGFVRLDAGRCLAGRAGYRPGIGELRERREHDVLLATPLDGTLERCAIDDLLARHRADTLGAFAG